MTSIDRSRHRPWPLPVAGACLSALSLGLAMTTTYAAPPATSSAPPRVATAAQPVAAPTCRPWQTRQIVPSGVTLTPRVFPTDEPPAWTAPAPPGTAPTPGVSRIPGASATTQTTVRVVCRNTPPSPYAHPAWAPGSVVGGPRLAETGVVVDRPAAVAAPPEVYDVSYVIADLGSGAILAAKSPHAWLRPASTLKALTALTLIPRLDPRRVVVASREAQAAAGTRVGILAGNRYPVSSLLDAMLMFSANDAAYALADAAGGHDRTVALMNEKAAQIGAHDTLTVDPSGLDDGAQRSSAYDLALIAREAMRLPAFRAAVLKRDVVFPGGKDRRGRVWRPFHVYNINTLLTHYPGAIGIKPGRTNRAQHTFIGAATRGGRTLLVAQMGSITGSWKPTAALLDWGFANADAVAPVGRLVEPGEASAPSPAPTLPELPSAGTPGSAVTIGAPAASWTSSAASAPSAGTGTPAPVAAPVAAPAPSPEAATSGRAASLAALAGVGAVVMTVVALVVAVRRRRRS